MNELVTTPDGRTAFIAPLQPDSAFLMVLMNGRYICVTTSELYKEVVETLLRNMPEVGTPYVIPYSGADFMALFGKAVMERLDACTPDEAFAVVNRAREVLLGLRNDDANRAFWPEVDALLAKLEDL